MKRWDVIVVGGGHAGIEAVYAAAKLDVSVLLVTLGLDTIGKLSCNPAVGGVSKGHLVREVDALGGLIGRLADECAIGYRCLNKSKGKAVWSTRAQVDRFRYPEAARTHLERQKNIEILQVQVHDILAKNKKVTGIVTNFGQVIEARQVIICAGTFLRSTLHIGLESFSGGRLYELSSDDLFKNIKRLGFKTKHFKTGTCARLDKRTLDFSKMTEQKPEYDVEPFSRHTRGLPSRQLSCYITHTNKRTHQIIRKNLSRSPLYSGRIKARGVRYCPSLEDKIVRFGDRDRHQVFIEPEGFDSIEIYPNGVSTSLPFDVQEKFIRTIDGLEQAVLMRPGYGIEHGVIDARQLYPTLEAKSVKGLFFAGQVNGTTGYEEAASQGVIAGINAALNIKRQNPFILRRDQALIGVLIDDLTRCGTDEPYRMFTSRSEFRLSLRESNADMRLLAIAGKLGLVGKEELSVLREKEIQLKKALQVLKTETVLIENRGRISLFEYLKRPQVGFEQLQDRIPFKVTDPSLRREIEILVKYDTFIRRQALQAEELKNMDRIKIPADFDFKSIPSLSAEIKEKLQAFGPATLGHALAISGITPAAVMIMYTYIVKAQKGKTHGHMVTRSHSHRVTREE
ncbi:MAG: tRNA uridine-5-carboxymethylaminomethyl(34) synthesis enzyme MnmG [Candidatus Omnitrophica bacterium]|nr:tRNA uridine-5-carboxymethylaminomethyl(34) synthesis enzyme MnmG [Candidatus Omnitrophota bacterium]